MQEDKKADAARKALSVILQPADSQAAVTEKEGLLKRVLKWYLDERCKDNISADKIDEACRRALAQSLSGDAFNL